MCAGSFIRPALVLIFCVVHLLSACTPATQTRNVPTSGALTAAPTEGATQRTQAEAPTAAVLRTRGGALTEAAFVDATSFHPYLAHNSLWSSYYPTLLFDAPLWRYNPTDLIPEPHTARSWTVSEDKLTYTFKLRHDLRWSDGRPLTAGDYAFAFERASKPENRYPKLDDLRLIVAYDAPDSRTLVIKLREPLAVGLEVVNLVTPLPRHVWESLDWLDPTKNPEIMAPTVVSGPFKLKEWRRGDEITFEANQEFHRGRPFLDRYTVRIVPSQEIAFQALKSGEVDTAPVLPENYGGAKATPHLRVYEWWPARAIWSYVGLNLRRPPLQDLRVRQALASAMDRTAIVEGLGNNLAQATYSIFPPSSWVYNPNVPRHDFNPRRASELLDEAGWHREPGGIRRKEGRALRLRLLYGPQSARPMERLAIVIAERFKDVGVDLEIQGLEWAAYQAALATPPFDWDLYVGAWEAEVEPHWANVLWREASIPDVNHVGYVNRRVEALFDAGVREFDRQHRKQVYQEIQQIISADAPFIFLAYSMRFQVVNARIGGIAPTPLGITHNIEQWHVR